MGSRWSCVISVFCIGTCLLFALACGGGGGGGGGGTSVAVSATLSYPSVAAKPGPEGNGLAQKAVLLTEAIVTLTMPNGTQYQMKETFFGSGKYTVTVSNFDDSKGFVIEAHKGTMELSKLVPIAALLGNPSTYDAGGVDQLSTAFVEIVKEWAISMGDALDQSGVDSGVGEYLMENIDGITAQIDLITLSDQVGSGSNDIYEQIVTTITAALEGADPDSGTTSVLADLDYSVLTNAIIAETITYPPASSDADAVRIVWQNLIDAYLNKNITAASATIAETSLWAGADKADLVSNWQGAWTADAATGNTETFSGSILAKEISPTKYWVGMRGIWAEYDSSGRVVEWGYGDDSIYTEEPHYIEKIDGVWLCTGTGTKFSVGVEYDQDLYYADGNDGGGSPTSTSSWVDAWVEQQINTHNIICTLTNPTVIGGPWASATDVGPDPDEDDDYWKDWWVGTSASSPSTAVTYTFTIYYSADVGGGSDTATTTISAYDDISSTGLKLNSFSVTASGISASWDTPTLSTPINELQVDIHSGSGVDVMEKEYEGTVTSFSGVSTAALTDGQTYYLDIKYEDLYGNDYSIHKAFIYTAP